MDIDHILEEFGATGRFPAEAVAASLQARAETVPVFLSILERAAARGGLEKREEQALFLIVHVLAELRETAAYRPVLRLVDCDAESANWLLGDAVTETLPQILIATFDGDLASLTALIESAGAYGFVRDSAFSAWTYLVLEGIVDRASAHAFLERFEAPPCPPAGNFVWNGWATAIALLGFEDLMQQVREACEDERIDLTIAEFDDYQAIFDRAQRLPRDDMMAEEELFPFEDTIGVLSQWAGFNPSEPDDGFDDTDDLLDFDLDEPAWDDVTLEPVTNPFRHVGRNDPCPCGSGKKFKKCCLPVVSA